MHVLEPQSRMEIRVLPLDYLYCIHSLKSTKTI